jgi:hypothetical protein
MSSLAGRRTVLRLKDRGVVNSGEKLRFLREMESQLGVGEYVMAATSEVRSGRPEEEQKGVSTTIHAYHHRKLALAIYRLSSLMKMG